MPLEAGDDGRQTLVRHLWPLQSDASHRAVRALHLRGRRYPVIVLARFEAEDVRTALLVLPVTITRGQQSALHLTAAIGWHWTLNCHFLRAF